MSINKTPLNGKFWFRLISIKISQLYKILDMLWAGKTFPSYKPICGNKWQHQITWIILYNQNKAMNYSKLNVKLFHDIQHDCIRNYIERIASLMWSPSRLRRPSENSNPKFHFGRIASFNNVSNNLIFMIILMSHVS